MANLFFSTMGNKSHRDTNGNYPQAGYGLTNAGSFQNMQSNYYWFGTEYAPDTSYAWGFDTGNGFQSPAPDKNGQLHAMAVRNGDVAPVPESEPYAMLLAGLALVGTLSRRRSRITSQNRQAL